MSAVPSGLGLHRHQAAYYRSDDELLDIVVPFLRAGVETGEPTVVSLGDERSALIQAALPGERITYLVRGEVYARPAGAIKSYRRLLADFVAGGAQRIRIVGELAPAAFDPAHWDWWARYESAVNVAYDEFPLWSVCAYDTTTTPAPVLADVARTHPLLARPGGGQGRSVDYVEPASFLMAVRPPADDPVQQSAPVLELVDPTPAQARRAAVAASPPALTSIQLDDLSLAVSEVVANASRHGKQPVLLRMWAGVDRVVVTVRDEGPGPTDPFAGLLPVTGRADGGLGLWLVHQLCSHISLDRGRDGFTLRLTIGSLGPASA